MSTEIQSLHYANMKNCCLYFLNRTMNNFKHSIESWGDLNWTMKAFECSKSATWNDPLLGYFHFTIEIDIKIMTQTELNEVKVPLFKPARIDTDYCFSTVNEITFFINYYYDLKKEKLVWMNLFPFFWIECIVSGTLIVWLLEFDNGSRGSVSK